MFIAQYTYISNIILFGIVIFDFLIIINIIKRIACIYFLVYSPIWIILIIINIFVILLSLSSFLFSMLLLISVE